MLEIADIFRQYGRGYLIKFGYTMPFSHRRAFDDIIDCQTRAMGGHVFECDHCGREHYAYHSCRNRSCPKCHARDTQTWLEERQRELLSVQYFHVVFTLPRELHPIVRSRQKVMYGLLMKAAAESLMLLAADPRYVGGRIGIMAVLHTWTQTLAYHPHVHCLVPGGGVSDDGQWTPARDNYLVPVKALSKLFRGKFMAMVAKKLPEVKLPQIAWDKEWVVYCKPTVQGADKVLNYLGRYVHRVAITNSRLTSIDNGTVTFRYKDGSRTQWKTMALAAEEFIRRFLQHVLPKGVHKVRYYGLWGPSNRKLLHRIQDELGGNKPNESSCTSANDERENNNVSVADTMCRHCGKGVLVHISQLNRQRGKSKLPSEQWRSPPDKRKGAAGKARTPP